jgi:hypothetical protein
MRSIQSCGQDVYSQRIDTRITCVFISTVGLDHAQSIALHGYNLRIVHTFIPRLSAHFSTSKALSFTSVMSRLIHDFHSTYNYFNQIKKGKRI